jgi:calcineurin-like phosphoesterase family protein
MNKIFVTADLHYNHRNIVKGVSKWNNKDATRDFETVEDMNKAIIESINNTVDKDDSLYLIGDLAFGDINSLIELTTSINCENLYCILGNHDRYIKNNKSFQKIVNDNDRDLKVYTYYTHSLFKKVSIREELVYKNYLFVIDHYPLSTWNQAMHGSIMIHGHVHGALDKSDRNLYYKRIDVDWGKFQRPVSIDEIIELMKDRKNLEY